MDIHPVASKMPKKGLVIWLEKIWEILADLP
jgi:hypothetical protein